VWELGALTGVGPRRTALDELRTRSSGIASHL
jgi:hypothetical protein